MKIRFKGLLLKKIDPSVAPALGLNRSFALPPNEEEIVDYILSEWAARWAAFDKVFHLDPAALNIDEQRARALIEYDTGIRADDPLWFKHLAAVLARRHVPGFSILNAGSNRHGAPVEWTMHRQAELIADVEYLRRKTGETIKEICRTLSRRKGYSKRWGSYPGEALRKAYSKAKKLSRGLLFQAEFCGVEATISSNGIDPIEALIERHALKVWSFSDASVWEGTITHPPDFIPLAMCFLLSAVISTVCLASDDELAVIALRRNHA